MKQIPILGLGINSGFPSITSQERINCYLEKQIDGEQSTIVAYGTPGKVNFNQTSANMFGANPVRGMYSFGDYLYVVYLDNFYKVNNAGVATLIGTIGTTEGYVSMACTGFEIFIADGTALGKVYTIASGAFAASNAPALTTVCFMDGYIVGNQPLTGKYYWSGLYDALTWGALDFATAESNPDNLVAVFSDHGGVILFGDFTTEIIGNSPSELTPWARVGYPIEWGCVAKASIAKLGDAVAFLARNRMGEAQVVLMSGYSPQRISTHDLERIINDSSSLESATAFSYMSNGHQFYQLNCADKSFLYDLASGVWSQVKGYGIDRDAGQYACNLLNRTIISDYSTGKLYTLSDTVYADGDNPLVMVISGKHIFNAAERLSISEVALEMEVGNGATTGQGTVPQVMMQYSKDGGYTWSNERWATSGEIGKYKTLVRWTRIGSAYNITFKFTISDPVKRGIIGAWATINA